MARRPRRQRVEPRLSTPAPRSELRAGDRAAPAQAKPSSRKPARRGGLAGFFGRIAYWGAVFGLWVGMASAGLLIFYGLQLPSVSTWAVPKRPPNVEIVALSGTVIGNRGKTGGEQVRLEQLPDYVANAVIAIEDRRFRAHFGVDPFGLGRAAAINLAEGRVAQGGSTLTQQLAKNMFLSPERSFRRKVQEVVLALWLEGRHSKDEILEMYLNRVYFGAGAYGVDAAARRYFDKPATHLRLAEAAVLAGLLKAPTTYAPSRNPEGAKARAALVLDAMAEEGFITEADAKKAKAARLGVPSAPDTGSENYVADWVMDQLPSYLGAFEGDVVVETTVDLDLQREAERALTVALAERGREFKVSQGALVALDGTGAVRALVGGRSYAASQFNRAVAAKRQPGSAFKPFVYLAALEKGLGPDTIRTDKPVRFGSWSPANYTGDHLGPVTLRAALSLSLNTVAAQLAMEVGPAAVIAVANRLGINSPLKKNASIALGTSEVTLLELTGAYAPFANGGYQVMPYVIERIATVEGKTLYRRKKGGGERVIEPRTLAGMNDMMTTTLEHGTGTKGRIAGWPAGGKTGTSQDFRDAWFVGYTANLTAGVWVGNDANTPMKRVTGGGLPAVIWADFMTSVHQGVPVVALPGLPLRGAPAEAVAADADPNASEDPIAATLKRDEARERPPQRERSIFDVILGR